ncbi:threonine/serine exporter ThrE family protein [uncultured Friedmanniella sp.]|uniref:threonine/serine ThrE exporter family protein n=1 Tax=uncultured Friedmanniella sp. TaxID=335381 RepID=UPI0035CA85BB
MTSTADPDLQVRRLLVHLGAAMVATGQPVSDIEEDVREVAAGLGHPDVQIAAGPTGVHVNLSSGEPSTFEAVQGSLRLDQAAEVRTIRHHLVQGSISLDQAIDQLLALSSRPPRYPVWLANLGWVGITVGIALILQPGRANVGFAAVGAVLVVALVRLSTRVRLVATLLPTLAAFAVACLVFAGSQACWLDGPLRTLLPPLAVLLPGALLVTAMSELATGHMVAGASRLTFGVVQLLLFTLGIAVAARLFAVPPAELANLRVDDLGWWAAPLGLGLITVGIGLLESPSLTLLPWIGLVLVLAFGAQTLGQALSGPVLGSFAGALAASLGASAVEGLRPDLPRLVVFLPAFWLLVPGSLGLVSTTQLAVSTGVSASTLTGVLGVVSGIALGLLVGAALAQSLRRGLRRARHAR